MNLNSNSITIKMGIFYNTYMYVGKLIKTTKDNQEIVLDDNEDIMKFSNGVIIFEKDKCILLSKMDPIIGDVELERGHVESKEVEKRLIKHFPNYQGTFDYSNGNVYLCETCVTTYDYPFEEWITNNLKVI